VALEKEDQHIVVQMASTVHLHAIVKQSKVLDTTTVEILLDAILAMIREPENSLSNKIALIEVIIELGSKFSDDMRQKVFQVLAPLASGKVTEGSVGMKAAEAENPLNPFKLQQGTPEQIVGSALYALARIEKTQPAAYGDKINSLIEKNLSDDSPEIRKSAFAAARELPQISDSTLTGVLFGTRDPDPKVAAMALDAIASIKKQNLGIERWHLLSYSLTMATKSPDKTLRRLAALTMKNLHDRIPEELSEKVEDLQRALANDICYSVREAVGKGSSK
jgi:hypothetical protein